MEALTLIIVACVAYTQQHFLRRDVATVGLVIVTQALLLTLPVQAYFVPGLLGLAVSLVAAVVLTVGIEKGINS